MTKWPQLTPKDIRDLTLAQVQLLLRGDGATTFKNMAEYQAWAQRRAR